MPSQPLSHENHFDSIRLLLTLLVVFSHSYIIGTGSENREPFVLLTRGQVTGGYIAVDLFFLMSGYLITASYLRSRNFGEYLEKRIRRIYPGFIVAMLFTTFCILPFSGGSLSPGRFGAFFNVANHLPRLQEPATVSAFATNPFPLGVNGSAWTVSYEFWCYIGVALLGRRFLSRRSWLVMLFGVTLVINVVFSVFSVRFYGSWLGLVFGYPVLWARFLPLFLAGMLAYLFREKLRYTKKGAIACFAVLAVAAITAHAISIVFSIVGGYLLFWAAQLPVHFPNLARRCGDLSYGVYLYAFPIQQLIVRLHGGPMRPIALFLLAAPIVLCMALLSWHLVERRFLLRMTDKQIAATERICQERTTV